MRAGWNDRLAMRLHRPDVAARPIVEGVVTESEDVRVREAEWLARDVVPGGGGVETLPDGGLRLFRNTATAIESAVTTSVITDFAPGPAEFTAAQITLPRGNPDREIPLLELHLVPQHVPAEPKQVAFWKLTPYRLVRVSAGATFVARLELQQIAPPKVEPASGGTVGTWVEFDFAEGGAAPRIGADPEDPDGSGEFTSPTLFVVLEALKSDGAPAGNTAWSSDGAQASVSAGGNTLAGATLARILEGEDAGKYSRGGGPGVVPALRLQGGSFEAATAGFLSAGNRIEIPDLSATSAIELVAQGESPSGSSLSYQVSADAATFFPFTDGDHVGQGPLAALPRQAFYYLKATLTPAPGGQVSPVVRALGARAVRLVDLDGIATVQTGGWSIDPVTLKGEITEATILIAKDGERDYRDAATELLALYGTRDLTFRLWIGHPDLPRADWLHLDTFLIDDYRSSGPAIAFLCLSVLSLLRTALPVPDTSNPADVRRAPYLVEAETLAAAYAGILDGELGIAARYRGEGIPSALPATVTKTVEDSDAKEELDALAYLAGGGLISSQGRIKYVDMLGARPPVLSLPSEELEAVHVTPGLRQRVPEFFVPFSWDEDEDRYLQEVQAVHAPSLAAIGTMGLDAPRRLDDATARWIDTQELADEVGFRTVKVMGTGLLLWSFHSIYPRPYLEPGDVVVVATDQFVARDPHTGQELRGALWATAVVQSIGDALGHEITVWIRSYADIFATLVPVDRSELKAPIVTGTLLWERIEASAPPMVALQLIAAHPAGEVAVRYRLYEEGTAPPALVRSPAGAGIYQESPFSLPIEIERPGPAEPAMVLEAYAEGPDGRLSEPLVLRIDHTWQLSAAWVPTLVFNPTQVGELGRGTLTVFAPRKNVTAIEWQQRIAGGAWTSPAGTVALWAEHVHAANEGIYGADATLVRVLELPIDHGKHGSELKFRVRFLGEDRAEQEPIGDAHRFDVNTHSQVRQAQIDFSATGAVEVPYVLDEDGDALRYEITVDGSTPADPTGASPRWPAAGSGRTGVIETGVTCLGGQTARLKLRGINLDGALSAEEYIFPLQRRRGDEGGTADPDIGVHLGEPFYSAGGGTEFDQDFLLVVPFATGADVQSVQIHYGELSLDPVDPLTDATYLKDVSPSSAYEESLKTSNGSTLLVLDAERTSVIRVRITPFSGDAGGGTAGAVKFVDVPPPNSAPWGVVVARADGSVLRGDALALTGGITATLVGNRPSLAPAAPVSAATGGSLTPDFASTLRRLYTLNAASTLQLPSNLADGAEAQVKVALSGYSVALAAGYATPEGIASGASFSGVAAMIFTVVRWGGTYNVFPQRVSG